MDFDIGQQVKVFFKDGSDIVAEVIEDDEKGNYLVSALSANKVYTQGDTLYVNPLDQKIEKYSLKYRLSDEPSLFNVDTKGVIFVGGDVVGVNTSGERTPYSIDWLEANATWAVRLLNSATRLKNYAKNGYNTIAFVAYKNLVSGMHTNPAFNSAIDRAINLKAKELGTSRKKIELDIQSKNPDLTPSQLQAMVLRFLKLKKHDIAEAIAVDEYKDFIGKIVGVAKFAGIETKEDRTVVHEVYPINVILENYTPVKPPIDFEEFLKEVGVETNHEWFRLRNFNFKLPVTLDGVAYLADLAEENDVHNIKVAKMTSIKKVQENLLNIKSKFIKKSEISDKDGNQVASIAVMTNGEILMGKRNDNGKWTLAGGHAKQGENPIENAIRELKEETGIEVVQEDLVFLGQDTVDAEGKQLIINCFLLNQKEKTNTSHDPDEEVEKWEYINVENGLPEEILNNLHSNPNITLGLLGLQESKTEKEASMKKISKSPEGWSDWIEEQKANGMSADEAFGIAWKQYNKGTKPPSKKKSIKEIQSRLMVHKAVIDFQNILRQLQEIMEEPKAIKLPDGSQRMMDSGTAKILLEVYNNVNDENKAKFEKLMQTKEGMYRLVDFAWGQSEFVRQNKMKEIQNRLKNYSSYDNSLNEISHDYPDKDANTTEICQNCGRPYRNMNPNKNDFKCTPCKQYEEETKKTFYDKNKGVIGSIKNKLEKELKKKADIDNPTEFMNKVMSEGKLIDLYDTEGGVVKYYTHGADLYEITIMNNGERSIERVDFNLFSQNKKIKSNDEHKAQLKDRLGWINQKLYRDILSEEERDELLKEREEINNELKELGFYGVKSMKQIQSNIRKTAKHFNYKFDKHKSQWKMDKESGIIEKDEEAVTKLARIAKRLKLVD